MIQFFHVTKQYSGAAPALVDVSLTVDRGQFVFITGPSGAGKSTLLRLVFCAEQATSGNLLVFGRNAARLRGSAVAHLRRTIGVVFQDFKLLPDRTVFENVAVPLEVRGLAPREVRRRVEATLRSVGLDDRPDVFPPSMSGGEQQRVSLARALVGDPALVLADEPTGNLDPERTIEVMELLQQANARGTTVVVATHDRDLLQRYRKRVVILERGRVAASDDVPRAVTA